VNSPATCFDVTVINMGTHTKLRIALAAITIGAMLLGAPGAAALLGHNLPIPELYIALGAAGALLGIIVAISHLNHHFGTLARLRDRMIILSSEHARPPPRGAGAPTEINALHDLLDNLMGPRSAAMVDKLSRQDAAPTPQPFNGATLLPDLPIFVFDCETTGLDVKTDVIVSIGGVRMQGGRIFRGSTIDLLVNPNQPIPARSTAIHGITNTMAADAEPFDVVWADLAPLMAGCVLVGHNIAFDIAHLRNATNLAGISWTPPPSLDTLLLGSLLDPRDHGFSLDDMATRYGVDIHGRHSALGDSLATAEIYAGMAPRLTAGGIRTLDDALIFSSRATAIIRKQRAAGWFDGTVKR
jgi:DNA polymerase III epsilon subunit family exonuclease